MNTKGTVSHMLHDEDGDSLEVTGQGQAVTIDAVHQNIHLGRSFYVHITDELASGEHVAIGFTTPAAPTYIHVVAEFSGGAEFTYSLEEDTGPITGGVAAVIYNRNRNSSQASAVTDAKVGYNGAQLSYTAGTDLDSRDMGHLGAGALIQDFHKHEWILQPETRYVAKLNSTMAQNRASLALSWYEVTLG